MTRILSLLAIVAAACGIASATEFAGRASATMDSLYSHYSSDHQALLRENHPFDDGYRAGYLAGEATETNKYSYLWPFSGTLTASRAMLDATGDKRWLTAVNEKVMPGLAEYRDTRRRPMAYASYIRTAPRSDRFYDDNVWLGIDFTDLYLTTGDTAWLNRAEEVWRFVESGMDKKLGGGIYWCEQKKHSKNTCSNAPGAVFALKLHQATGNKRYLELGRNLYHWTKTNLQDTTDCLYFDNISVRKNHHIGRAKFAYNSGQMMQAASLLHKITGDSTYLADAQAIARSAFREFFPTTATDAATGREYRVLKKGDIWFTAVMMRGFAELYALDGNPVYINDFLTNMDNAWTLMRDPATGLFSEDWSGAEKKPRKWLLTQAAMVEMMALAATLDK